MLSVSSFFFFLFFLNGDVRNVWLCKMKQITQQKMQIFLRWTATVTCTVSQINDNFSLCPWRQREKWKKRKQGRNLSSNEGQKLNKSIIKMFKASLSDFHLHFSCFAHELSSISLISLRLHKACSYYTKWSVLFCVCVCGLLANGISLIHSINSFHPPPTPHAASPSRDTIHLKGEDVSADTHPCASGRVKSKWLANRHRRCEW